MLSRQEHPRHCKLKVRHHLPQWKTCCECRISALGPIVPRLSPLSAVDDMEEPLPGLHDIVSSKAQANDLAYPVQRMLRIPVRMD